MIDTIFTIAVMAMCFKLGMNSQKRASDGESSINVIEGVFTDIFVVTFEVIRFIVVRIRGLFKKKSDKDDKDADFEDGIPDSTSSR